MMLKLKLQYLGHLMRNVDSLEKTLMVGGIGGRTALCIKCPKYWSFSFNFSISHSSEYSVLISFKIDWFDLLAV